MNAIIFKTNMCKLSVQITDFYCIYDLIQISNCRAIHFGATVQFFLMTMVSNTKSSSSKYDFLA